MSSIEARPAGALDLALEEPPHDFAAEQGLLGSLLVDNRIADDVRDRLQPEHFADPLHGELYAAALRLIDRGLTANPISMRAWFDQHGRAAKVPNDYLARLMAESVHRMDSRQLAEQVRRKWQLRQMLATAQRIRERAMGDDGESDLESLVQGSASDLDSIVQHGERGAGFAPLSRGMTTAVTSIEAAYKRGAKLAGLSSGFGKIDNIIGGFNASDLIIIAGRPSMGKTALAVNIAANVAKPKVDENGKEISGTGVGFFSLEMSAEQLATRLLAEQSGISSSHLRQGDLGTSAELDKVIAASQALESWPLYIDDRGGLTLDQLRTEARRLKRQHELGLLVVDYLQLLAGSDRRRDGNRVQEVSEITRGLKALAKEMNLPIIALSQLSRDVEKRDDKRPQLADLRESGSIEQDADAVMFVYREEYYLQSSEPAQKDGESLQKFNERHEIWVLRCQQATGKAEIIIGKNRHGPTGTAELQFEGRFTRFTDP